MIALPRGSSHRNLLMRCRWMQSIGGRTHPPRAWALHLRTHRSLPNLFFLDGTAHARRRRAVAELPIYTPSRRSRAPPLLDPSSRRDLLPRGQRAPFFPTDDTPLLRPSRHITLQPPPFVSSRCAAASGTTSRYRVDGRCPHRPGPPWRTRQIPVPLPGSPSPEFFRNLLSVLHHPVAGDPHCCNLGWRRCRRVAAAVRAGRRCFHGQSSLLLTAGQVAADGGPSCCPRQPSLLSSACDMHYVDFAFGCRI
jgi:hypothetical protein